MKFLFIALIIIKKLRKVIVDNIGIKFIYLFLQTLYSFYKGDKYIITLNIIDKSPVIYLSRYYKSNQIKNTKSCVYISQKVKNV